MFTNLHYASFTDMAWAPDGQSLMLASSDGYCSIVVFDEILPLHHTQQHNLQLQSIVQSHTVSPSHAREHSGVFNYNSGVPPHSPALSISSIVRGSTPGPAFSTSQNGLPATGGSLGLTTPLSRRTERSESLTTIPALGLEDMGGPSSSSTSLMPAPSSMSLSSDTPASSDPAEAFDTDGPPAKKKRRIALTHHSDAQ